MRYIRFSRRCLWLLTIFLLPALSTAAQKTDTHKTAQIDRLMAESSSGKKPGAAVLVVQNGKIIFQKGYGLAELKTGGAIAPDTAFDLGSVTKQFTALAVLQLAERGKLSLDDSLRKFFPEFPAYADKITVRHLLGHTSGLPDYAGWFIFKSGRIIMGQIKDGFEPRNEDAIKFLAEQKEPRFTAGDKWEYSNSGYVVLASIVEKASGMRYARYVEKNIFEPLKMRGTAVYGETKPKIANRAVSYQKKGENYEIVDFTPMNLIYGDGSINSTIEDLAKWDAALYTEKLVKAETLKQAFAPGKLNDGKATDYGYGWFVKQTPNGSELSHGGSWEGFRNFIIRNPEKKLSIVVLSNSAEFKVEQNARRIARIFSGENN